MDTSINWPNSVLTSPYLHCCLQCNLPPFLAFALAESPALGSLTSPLFALLSTYNMAVRQPKAEQVPSLLRALKWLLSH
jgi:hypothetical protein